MKILYIHNDYGKKSGEEIAAESLVQLLQEHGHEVKFFRRSSAELHGIKGQIKGFFAGIYNPFAARQVAKTLDEFQPDLVQVQNLYPLLSPSIFNPIKQRHIPVVMRCPNYRLFCPTGLCFNKRTHQVCEKCLKHGEWHCIVDNCEASLAKSLGYAVRNFFARKSGLILKQVDQFIVQTEFQKGKFVRQGILAEKIGIVPGIMPAIEAAPWTPGSGIAYIGRVSQEKGIDDFIAAARALPQVEFQVVGNYDPEWELVRQAPANVKWLGFHSGAELREIYLKSRLIVIPSRCYEGFPNVIVTAMMLRRPIVTTNLGACGSIITDQVDGLKFTPGDVADLTQKLQTLYSDLKSCEAMGNAGRERALALYTRDKIYQTLMEIYQQAKNYNK